MMNKLLVLALALVAFTAMTAAQPPPVEELTDEETDEKPDKIEKIQELIGDVAGFPEWFQKVIKKKLENIQERHDKKQEGKLMRPGPGRPGRPGRGRRPGKPGRRGGPGRRGPPGAGLFRVSEEDLAEIEGIPEWFTGLLEAKKNRPKKTDRNQPPPPIEFGDDVPDWFKTWFNQVQEKLKAMHEERRDQRPGDKKRPDQTKG